jgi:hypothetical protein
VCGAFELVKEAEMKKFGEKSYFYCKANGLPPVGADDDLDPIDDTRTASRDRRKRRRRRRMRALWGRIEWRSKLMGL